MHKDIAFWCTDEILHKKALTVFLCTGMFLDSEAKKRVIIISRMQILVNIINGLHIPRIQMIFNGYDQAELFKWRKTLRKENGSIKVKADPLKGFKT